MPLPALSLGSHGHTRVCAHACCSWYFLPFWRKSQVEVLGQRVCVSSILTTTAGSLCRVEGIYRSLRLCGNPSSYTHADSAYYYFLKCLIDCVSTPVNCLFIYFVLPWSSFLTHFQVLFTCGPPSCFHCQVQSWICKHVQACRWGA